MWITPLSTHLHQWGLTLQWLFLCLCLTCMHPVVAQPVCQILRVNVAHEQKVCHIYIYIVISVYIVPYFSPHCQTVVLVLFCWQLRLVIHLFCSWHQIHHFYIYTYISSFSGFALMFLMSVFFMFYIFYYILCILLFALGLERNTILIICISCTYGIIEINLPWLDFLSHVMSFAFCHYTFHSILSLLLADGPSGALVRIGGGGGGDFLFVYLSLVFQFRIRFSY